MKHTHTHRIIPGHLGGEYTPENTVELTIEQHAKAHWVEFMLEGRREDYLAWQLLSGQITKQELIESVRTRVRTDEERQRISSALKGVKKSEETRRKMSKAQIGKKWPEERKKKLSDQRKGIPLGPRDLETRRKIMLSYWEKQVETDITQWCE